MMMIKSALVAVLLAVSCKAIAINDEDQLIDDIFDSEQDVYRDASRYLNFDPVDEGEDGPIDLSRRSSYENQALLELKGKAVELDRFIKNVEGNHNPEVLAQSPRWKRLIQLRDSLREIISSTQDSAMMKRSSLRVMKKSPFSVDFMGMQVSYPQYLRLKQLQEKVIQLDILIRKLRKVRSEEVMNRNPKWKRLIHYHTALKKMLPPSYLKSIGEDYSVPM